MSANTSISEGGKGYSFSPVKALMVEGDNGEFYPWYPEADRALDSLNVDKNGIYRASDRGVYGWNHVSVNVAQTDRVTGKDPETGEEKTVTVDPETGELVETVVPTEIRVTTLPTKTEYTHGETIDYSGIVVHAYSSTGQDMGAVPFNQLIFPATTALGGDEWSDGAGLNAKQVTFMPKAGKDIYGREITIYVSPVMGSYEGLPAGYGSYDAPYTILISRYSDQNYGLLQIGSGQDADCFLAGQGQDGFWRLVASNFTIEGDGMFHGMYWGENITDVPVSSVNPTTVDPSALHATQSIPVQWQDPDSGAILETSFNITVTGGE